MRRFGALSFAAGSFLACTCGVAQLLAQSPWLLVNQSAACAPSTDAFSQKVLALQFGVQDPELSATAHFKDEIAGTRVTLRVLRGLSVVGTKEVSAATCDEAINAAASVLAIALSGSTDPPDRTSEAPNIAPSAEPPPSDEHDAPPPPTKRIQFQLEYDGELPHITDYLIAETPQPLTTTVRDRMSSAPRTGKEDWRASVLAGVDAGTVNDTAMSLGAALSRRSGHGELRLSGSFVQPFVSSISENYEFARPNLLLSREVQYAIVSGVDYCYGIDRQRWLSACGGIELNASNYLVDGGQSASPTRWSVGLGPTLGALFVLRQGLIQPELLARASVPLVGSGRLGAAWGPATVALRFSAGASMSF